MPPLISVITACYNSADTIVATLESVLAQTYPNVEHIIVNDGSTDQLESVLQPYIHSTHIKYIAKPNGGVSSARNEGAAVAQGEFFVFLDADDQLKPDYLQKCAALLLHDSEAGLAITGVKEFDAGKAKRQLTVFNFEQFLFDNVIPCAAMLRKKDFWQYGPYDVNMAFAEDWNLWISILKHHPKVLIVPELLFLYRRHVSKQTLSVIADKQKHLQHKAYNQIYANHPELYDRYISESPLSLFLDSQRLKQDSVKILKKLKQQINMTVLILILGGCLLITQATIAKSYPSSFIMLGYILFALALLYHFNRQKSLKRSWQKIKNL